MKVVFYGNNSGARYWRFVSPAKYMARLGVEVRIPDGGMSGEDLSWADIIIIQGLVDRNLLAMVYAFQQEHGKKVVVEFDDWINVERHSPHFIEHQAKQVPETMKISMGFADMITTTTEYLANKFRRFNRNVKVLPNFIDPDLYLIEPKLNGGDKVRISWAGSMTHIKDLEMIRPSLNKVLKKYPNVEIVFMGDPRLKDMFPDSRVSALPGVGTLKDGTYPRSLFGQRVDIGLAPIRDSEFNRCKSNIKPMEYGMMGVPCVASNVEPYKYFPEDTILRASNNGEWFSHLCKLIDSKTYRKTIGGNMKQYLLENFMLDKKIGLFVDAYKSLM